MRPVEPDYRENRRDDGYSDFAALKASGHVRDKRGDIIPIDKPHIEWAPLDRDHLYQRYCEFAKTGAGEEALAAWIDREAEPLRMSATRAADIINEGNGQYPGANMRWWRGVSL